MGFRFEDVLLHVRTPTRETEHRARFASGLNVIEAPNTWGKSTLVQSLIYGLGLEGAFSASHLSPLGEAMSSVIDLAGHREAVVESAVTVTLSSDEGRYLRARRYTKSFTFESSLIETWTAASLPGLDTARQVDYYVRQPGAASHELGFHRLLEDFIGYDLPGVPGFNGDEVKLYLEVLLPLFYVEQKYGWAGLAPRVPTHYRIRSPYRRAAEYVLGLESLERLKEAEKLRARLASYQAEWSTTGDELDALLRRNGWSLSHTLDSPESIDGSRLPEVGLSRDGGFVDAAQEIARIRSEAEAMLAVPVPPAGTRTAEAQSELRAAEQEVQRLAGRLRLQQESVTRAETELGVLEARQRDLESDRSHLLDVRKLERLGSEIGAASLESAHCPTCSQDLDARQVATGLVLDVSANLALLTAEKATLDRMTASAEHNLTAARGVADAVAAQLADSRARTRALKDELAGPSGAPSVAHIERRIVLAERARVGEADLAQAYELLARMQKAAVSMARVRTRLKAIRGEAESGSDAQVVAGLRLRFIQALEKFGLRSLPVSEITIGADSLLPEHDGFELTFDIRHGLSASDAIRTKWAFYVALTRSVNETVGARPLGVLIIDEPRQQEADAASVRALYRELAVAAEGSQVIVASSAPRPELDELLTGLAAHRLPGTGTHMFSAG